MTTAELHARLRAATTDERHRIARAVGVGIGHIHAWADRDHLDDVAPWAKTRILQALTTNPKGRRR